MKKFLSALLTLSMLIVPVGAISSFADDGQGSTFNFGEVMKACNIDMMQVIADVNKDGKFVLHSRCFANKGHSLEIIEIPKGYYSYFAKKLNDLKILDIIKKFECSMARVIFERSAEAEGSVHAIIYNAQGKINRFLIDL